MKNYYLLLVAFISCLTTQAQIINFPDSNFKYALLNTGPAPIIDTNFDGEIEVSEAAVVTFLAINNSTFPDITSVEGLQYFINLQELHCDYNTITGTLDVSMMPHLHTLNCSYNQLTTLTLGAQSFDTLDCSHNQLTQVNGSQITSIYYAYFNDNLLTTLELPTYGYADTNISNNPLVSFAYQGTMNHFLCNNTAITSLDLSGVSQYYNPSVIISNNPNLQYLNFKNGLAEGCILIPIGNETCNFSITNNPALLFVCTDDFYSEQMVFQQMINNPNVMFSSYCSFAPGGAYNTIAGNVTLDCGSSNIVLPSQKIKIANGTDNGFTYTNTNGNYTMYTGLGTQTVTPDIDYAPYFTVTPSNYTFNFTTGNTTETANFCLTANGVHPDVEVNVFPMNVARPGFDAKYKIVYKNKGNQVESGSIALTFDDAVLDFVTATPATDSQATNTLNWNFSNLAPFESRSITFTLNVNSPSETPAVNIGDILSYEVAIVTALTDETPNDNEASFPQAVMGSYDPNDKTVVEGSQLDITKIGEYLHYVVRFQNTGTYAATNVVVKDMLDSKLDWNTLEMVSSSHPYRSTLTQGNKLEVFYEDINLPPSSLDEPNSHGYISFMVKPKSSVVLNNVIANTAYIYFDFNLPITTNTVTTTVTALGTPTFSQGNLFTIYPNPTSSQLNIKVSDNAVLKSILICNTLGQTVITANSMVLDISPLCKGTYFITVETDKGKQTQKVIKL